MHLNTRICKHFMFSWPSVFGRNNLLTIQIVLKYVGLYGRKDIWLCAKEMQR